MEVREAVGTEVAGMGPEGTAKLQWFRACDAMMLWEIVVVEWHKQLLWQHVILLLQDRIFCLLLGGGPVVTL